jgi:hypothetical protein
MQDAGKTDYFESGTSIQFNNGTDLLLKLLAIGRIPPFGYTRFLKRNPLFLIPTQ